MSNAMADIAMRVLEGPLIFTDYEPRGKPGFESNIAQVMKMSPSETADLLVAADSFVDDHHYEVFRKPVGTRVAGSKGKEYPQEYKVTITTA
jgi:hypothetical protein